MSDYGRIGDYIGPVAAKKLSAVDIDANSSNQHEFGGNDALRTRTANQSAWPAPATSCASVCSGTIAC